MKTPFNSQTLPASHPLQRLRLHVSGAIQRGESVVITEQPAPVYSKANAPTFRARIAKANTVEALGGLSRSLNRLWVVGAFTAVEFKRLDLAICDKMESLSNS